MNRAGLLASAALGLFCGATAPAVLDGQALPDRLSLEEALRIGLNRSQEVRSASAAADREGAAQRAAWGAFLPTASASLSLSRSSFTRTTFVNPQGESQTLPEPLESSSKSTSQGLSFSWDLLNGGRRFAALGAQSDRVRGAQRRLDDARRRVAAAVGRAYLDALRAQGLIDLAERQLDERRTELEVTRRRYEIAAVDRTDVLGAENNLLNAEINLLSEQAQLADFTRGLAVAMGLPADETAGVTLVDLEDVPEAAALAADNLVARAVSTDPELSALEADRDAASADLWSARSRYLPTISLSYSLSRNQSLAPQDPFFFFDPSDRSNSFGISVSWTLFDGFQREQQTAQASSSRRQAEQTMIQRRHEIEREVHRIVAELRRLDRSLVLSRRSLDISRERLDMTRQMYQNGTRDFTALQQAISEVTSAERTVITQRYDYLKAWTDLEEFVGDAR